LRIACVELIDRYIKGKRAVAKSREELVRILKSNIKAFNNYRQETNNEPIDLSGADLTGTNLCRANLEKVTLKDAELNFAYLHSAILKNSNLSDLTVGRADMTETDLTDSILENTDLTNTILYGANMTRVKASGIVLEGSKVRETNFTEADLTNGNLSNLDLNGVNFRKTILKGTDFTGSNLSNALNLQSAIFDNSTLWPVESSHMPADFDVTGKITVENDSDFNAEFGPGIMPETQEYEFLDMPAKQETSDIPIGETTTELSSPFEKHEEVETEFRQAPSFEDFTPDQFIEEPVFEEPTIPKPFDQELETEQYDQLEPGLASPEPELESLEPLGSGDEFLDSFSTSFNELSQQGPEKQLGGLGSISDQDFPIQGAPENLKPSEELLGSLELPEDKMPFEEGLPTQEFTTFDTGIDPSLEQKRPLSQADSQTRKPSPPPPIKKAPPPPKPERPQPPESGITPDQMQPIMRLLTGISKKIETMEEEQKKQKAFIQELKKNTDDKHLNDMLSHKVEDISMTTRSLFSRLESKVDIIAQTDPLDQLDSLLGELADSIRSEQQSIEAKIVDLSSIMDSTVALIESESISKGDVDFTALINNFHQMLTNLESNVREDQDTITHKIDDLATVIEGLSLVFENSQSDIKENTAEKITSLVENISTVSENIDKYGTNITSLQDTVNNINNTVGTIIELNSDTSAESQIYEAFYDFEFRLQLELEKSHGKLGHLETLFDKAYEKIDLLTEKTANLEKINKIENIPKMLETFRNQLFTEIQQTEQRTNRLREVVDDMVIQLESLINMQISRVQHTLQADIAGIDKKIETLLSRETSSFNEKVDSLHNEIQDVRGQMELSGGHLNMIANQLNTLGNKIDQFGMESKLDDELRAIFEHLLLQVSEYANSSDESASKLNKKFEDLESELQMTLKDMDRRISKINSMIRNVYKGLDSITDLITEGSRAPRSGSITSDKPRRTLAGRTKDIDLDLEDEEI
jgi:uncharacterized protein YjbI with pentapeptide repeats